MLCKIGEDRMEVLGWLSMTVHKFMILNEDIWDGIEAGLNLLGLAET